MKDFFETNIKYIRRWYLFYTKGLQAVALFDESIIELIK